MSVNTRTNALPTIFIPEALTSPEGLYLVDNPDRDLLLHLPWWRGVTNRMRLQAAWGSFDPFNPVDPGDKNVVGKYTEVSSDQVIDSSTVFKIAVPKILLTVGEYLLRVRIRSVPGGSTDWTSAVRVKVVKILDALPAPTIPTAAGGLRRSDLDDPQRPIFVRVVLASRIVENTTIDLCWQGRTVARDIVNQDHLATGAINLQVFPPDILMSADGEHSFNYIATAPGGGRTENSEIGRIKVKTTVPGGYDPEVGTEHINENLAAPSGIPEHVDTAIAEQGLTVIVPVYINMSVGDVVGLDWGGQRLTHPPLTVAEVGKPVTFRIENDVLGTHPGPVDVRYEVRDEVANWSKWSLSAHTEVVVSVGALTAPSVIEALMGNIDLIELGDEDIHVSVPVYENMNIDDKVVMIWHGETAEGASVPVILSQIVQAVGRSLVFIVPNPKVRAITQGHAVATYTVYPANNGLPRPSHRSPLVHITGQTTRLSPPQVSGVVGNVLDPDTLPAMGAIVTIVANSLIEAGDNIVLSWSGVAADNTPLLQVDSFVIAPSMDGQDIIRHISLTHITPLLNGSASVSFVLYKDGVELHSDDLRLQVKHLAIQLPKPRVDYAEGDTLNPDHVPANGTKMRVNYSPMEAGDRINMHWKGVLDFADYFPVPVSWNDKEVVFPIPKNHVVLNENQTVQAFYTVTRSGQLLPPSLKQLLLIGSTLELKPPSIKEALGNSLDPFATKDTLTVVVPRYPGMDSADQLIVTWRGTSEGSYTSPMPLLVGIVEAKEIAIHNSVVAFNLGKSVIVTYDVMRGGESISSQAFHLTIQSIPDNDVNLEGIAKISQAGDGRVLDVSSFSDDGTFRVNEWPLMAVNQKVWLRLHGTQKDGRAYERVLWSSVNIDSAQVSNGFLEAAIARADLTALRDASDLKVEFKVNFSGQYDESHAVTFPVPIYTLKISAELPPFIVDQSVMVLDGLNINASKFTLSGEHPLGTVATRVPTSGSGNYLYHSSDAGIATVQNGLVCGLRNGRATITVIEKETQRTKSFPVRVSNVFYLAITSGYLNTLNQAIDWMNSIGGAPISDAAYNVIKIKYLPYFASADAGAWMCRKDGCGPGKSPAISNTKSAWSKGCYNGLIFHAFGWCLLQQ